MGGCRHAVIQEKDSYEMKGTQMGTIYLTHSTMILVVCFREIFSRANVI